MADTPLQAAAAGGLGNAVAEVDNPATESGEYRGMKAQWELVSDITAGIEVVRKKGQRYLPKYQDESSQEYDRRLAVSPWRPEFSDALNALAAKPFTKDVSIKNGAAKEIMAVAEDIDGRGNSQTAFLRDSFHDGIAKGVHAILVDFPALHPDGAARVSLAEEKARGARPYWLQISADDILALYTTWVGGKEIVSHFRFKESYTERVGFSEVSGTRIRVYEPGYWEVWQKADDQRVWQKTSKGVINRNGHTSVPVVPFFTGKRLGDLRVKPPLIDLAHMQLELYRAQSRKEEVMTYASSPMLAANGLAPPKDGGSLSVGPKTVLYAPVTTDSGRASWEYISPDAANVKEIRQDVEGIIQDMQRLGMQPMIQRTGRPTATGDSIEAAKAHTVLQAWALGLKDVAEQCWVLTAQWMSSTDKPEITIYTDFSTLSASAAPLAALATARAGRDLSRRSYWVALQRYNVLPADFDPNEEEKAITDEPQFATAELPKRDPVTGLAVAPPPTAIQQAADAEATGQHPTNAPPVHGSAP